jgi:hypothetical protein
MNRSTEAKMLRSVLKRIDSPPQRFLSSRWLMPSVWLAFVILVAVFCVVGQTFGIWVAAFGFIFLGMGYMHIWFKASAARGWPLLARHFNRESIEARLRELES